MGGTVTNVSLLLPSQLSLEALRRKTLANVLRAGHCAPTVMKTLVEGSGPDADWLVQLASGLPGGIGDSRNECGGITAPLIVLGLRHSDDPDEAGVPVVVAKGRALLQDFRARHRSHACRDIMILGRLPLRCPGVVRRAPERCLAIDVRPCGEALTAEERQAFALLHAHLVEKEFHCAHAVLRQVREPRDPEPALLDATSAFVAGTAYSGLTCSALAAGVMLLGLARGEPAHRPGRVFRAMAGMALGNRAFTADLEAVNGAMDLGGELVSWFRRTFGSTQCLDLVGADFSTVPGAARYIGTGGVQRCREIAHAVAEHTLGRLRRNGLPGSRRRPERSAEGERPPE